MHVNNIAKCFNWRDSLIAHTWPRNSEDPTVKDQWVGTPIYIRDAIYGYTNVTYMNAVYLLDYHMRKFEKNSLRKVTFRFSYPDTSKDVLSINELLKFRRKFILIGNRPQLQQTMRVDDIDKIIETVHANSSFFNPKKNRTPKRKLVTRWAIEENSNIYFADDSGGSVLYDWLWMIGRDTYGITYEHGSSIEGFLMHPQTNADLNLCYNQIVDIVTERISDIERPGTTPIYGFTPGGCESALQLLKIDSIMQKLRVHYEIPRDLFEQEEENLRVVVKQRLVQWIIRLLFQHWEYYNRNVARTNKRFRDLIFSGRKLVVRPNSIMKADA